MRLSGANEEIGRHSDEADLSTESDSSETKARISRSDEFSRRPGYFEAPQSQGPHATRSHDPVEIAVIQETGRFERADRILNSKEYQRIGRLGKRLATAQFVVFVMASEAPLGTECRRLGVTVSRRVGKAVVRNRIKRGVREWFRQNRESLTDPVDLIVIARKAASSLTAGDVGRALNEMLFAERSASS